MGERASIILALIILLIVAAAGVYGYEASLGKYERPLSRLEPRVCGGYHYPAGPEGLAMVYDRRATAYVGNTVLDSTYSKELVFIAQVNCDEGYALVANKTWSPQRGESPWTRMLILFSADPTSLRYVIPEELLLSLTNATIAPGMIAWKSVSGSAGGYTINISIAGSPGKYVVREIDAFDPSTGILTYRRVTLTLKEGSSGSQVLPLPDRIVSETVIEKAYVNDPGTNNFYQIRRLVDTMAVIGLAMGTLVAAGLLGALKILAEA
ncbi:MAG: hypothetical protein F7C34_01870 [Desulfurococcales archaeon]|nr:hypothetical protein [Desulfurococcales archaeon]